jgi:hypothetical protein
VAGAPGGPHLAGRTRETPDTPDVPAVQAEPEPSAAEETSPEHRQLSALADVPELTPEEMAHLKSLRSEMPRQLGDGSLLQGDVDALLKDPAWNPDGSVLTAEERAALEELVRDFRFFARAVTRHRVENLIRPEVERLRELGAYVEIPASARSVSVPGVTISFGELSHDDPKMRRIYYFQPQDYPALYHLQRLERQRSYEAFVKIYHTINRRL